MDHTRNPDRVFRWGAWGDHSGRCALYPAALADGNVFPARYELVFLAAGVILFSLFVGVVMLPILLQHIESRIIRNN